MKGGAALGGAAAVAPVGWAAMGRWLEGLARRGDVRVGAAWVIVAGLGWAVLCLVLAFGGHAPSVAFGPIPRGDYYRFQAAFVVPVLLVCWLLCAAVASGVARALGGTGRFAGTAAPMGPALAAPLLLLLVVPDAVVYAAAGFDALGPLVRVTGPLMLVATVTLATLAVRAAHGLGAGRALVAAVAGVLAQAVIGGALLR